MNQIMKRGSISQKVLCFAAAVLLLLILLPFDFRGVRGNSITLNIALYPYVPDQARFEHAIETLWTERHPDVELNFVAWDCYAEDPRDDLDVFVYDSIFLYDFLEQGYLLPLTEEDVQNIEDIVPCAISACEDDGAIYAVPQLLCTNILYGRKGDDDISDVQTIHELDEVMEEDTLLMSIPDHLSMAFWYLEVGVDLEQKYSEWTTLPDTDHLDPDIMETLRSLQKMSGMEQMTYVPEDRNSYIRGEWFADDFGRACIGFSEIMSAMGEAADDVTFHRISLSDEPDIPMLFADIASIHARIDDAKKPLAIELLNMITGQEAMNMALSAGQENQSPQYLLSARMSVYDMLSRDYPIYGKLKELVTDPECKVFLVRPSGRAFAEKAKQVLPLPLPQASAQ